MPPQDFDIIGFGAVNVDYIVAGPTDVRYFDDLERGDERHEEDFELLQESIRRLGAPNRELRVQLGGSALNTVRALAGLAPDLRVGFVSVAGGAPATLPSGATLDTLPPSVELMIDWLGGPHGVCVSVVEDETRTLTTYNNPEAARSLRDPDRRARIVEQLARARLVHVTSFFGDTAPHEVAALMADVRERRPSVRFAVDLGQVWARTRSAREEVLRLADIVFLNEAELSFMTPSPSSTRPHECERERATWMLDRLSTGATRVIILKKRDNAGRDETYVGQAGAVMYSKRDPSSEILHHEVLREALDSSRILDSTGAGDVFAAGALAALYSPTVEALRVLQLGFAAAVHKMQHPGLEGYRDLDCVLTDGWIPPGRGKVFISHARNDKKLVTALVELFHAGSPLKREKQFFCSSLAVEGLQTSEPVRKKIWQELRAAEYVIFVVTQAFLDSRECSYELGAVAALGIPNIPLLAPGRRFDDHEIPVAHRAGGHLDQRRALVNVWSRLSDIYEYARVDQRTFDERQQAVVDEALLIGETVDLMTQLSDAQADRKAAKSPKATAKPGRRKSVKD